MFFCGRTQGGEENGASKLIALTFDDGPSSSTPMVLDKLEKYNIVASFFVLGAELDAQNALIIGRALKMGCEINNHSRTHSDMTKMTREQILAELKYTSDKVMEITGEPTRFFRPPYIAVNDLMFDSIDMPFICGYGADDYDDSISAQERSSRILEQISDGSIILLHDSSGNIKTVEALDLLIPVLIERGYIFVTVSQLFQAKKIVPEKHARIIFSYAEQTTMYG